MQARVWAGRARGKYGPRARNCVDFRIMRETRDPHYLHERKDLEPVVSPPVDEARVLEWLPNRAELLVGSSAGELSLVDPIMGTRVVCTDLGEPAALSISPDAQRVAVISRGVGLEVRNLSDGSRAFRVMEPLLADLWVGWWQGGLCFAGEGMDGRRAVVIDRFGVVRVRARLSDGAVVGVGKSGGLLSGRVTNAGLEVVPLGAPFKVKEAPTRHRLRFAPCGVIYGIVEGGVTVWLNPARPPNTIRVHGATSAALSDDGQKIAIGTRNGGVTLTETLGEAVERCHPGQTEGHEKPVQAVAFSHKGRWIATAGEACWLWSY